MEKQSIDNLADGLVATTQQYTDIYFKVNGKDKPLNKELWAALHIGYVAGLKMHGYTDKEADEVIEKTQKILTDSLK